MDNLQTHADLIAGLPSYSLDMLCRDIVTLVGTGVDELQLESLKVLPGTQMRRNAATLGLRYSPLPPYEILQTEAMSPADLRKAMRISRMIDLYYNAETWQKVIRDLIAENTGFIREFTDHLETSMVLDSPLSLERRGVILYGYCKENHPTSVTDVSIAWIEAGCSLKKEPAGDIIKIKHLDAWLTENHCQMTAEYGTADPSHRYYLLTSGERKIVFGYDSLTHQPAPVFRAEIHQQKS